MGKDDTIMNTARGLDISRYMLKSSKFTITFTSYAFPHGVERDIPVIRAEAIKHQLRFWWRIMTLSNGRYLSSSELKAKEDDLFGGIGKEGGKKSRITIQMLPASMPLASQIDAKPFSALGYLAYGTGGRSNQKQGYVPGDSAEFILSYPIERESEILGSLALMNGFGSIGGRSRKGIGSFIIESDILDIPSFASIAGSFAVMDWRDVYQGKLASISFPFCIAKDQVRFGVIGSVRKGQKGARRVRFENTVIRRLPQPAAIIQVFRRIRLDDERRVRRIQPDDLSFFSDHNSLRTVLHDFFRSSQTVPVSIA